MVTAEPVLVKQDLNTIDWGMLTITTTTSPSITHRNTSLEKQHFRYSQLDSSSSFLYTNNMIAHLVPLATNTVPSLTTTLPPTPKVHCPICSRFLSTKDLGRCSGVPTADYPLKSSITHHSHSHSTLNSPISPLTPSPGHPMIDFTPQNPRKRKRTELRSAHETRLAPCHDCLDTVGEEDGRVWGRCDNPKCWSRKGETGSTAAGGSDSIGARGGVDGLGAGFPGVLHREGGNTNGIIGLVCPDCSPEGGLGCAHRWICDMCAFWGKFPLVWECPGCQNDFCDKCPEMQDRCVECGYSDLCRDCRKDPGVVHELAVQMGMSGEPLGPSKTTASPLFEWRCRLCNIPVCNSCVGTARWGGRVDDCDNCKAQLCMGCRSVMECTGCGEEMCQLCPMESLALQCKKCAIKKGPFAL